MGIAFQIVSHSVRYGMYAYGVCLLTLYLNMKPHFWQWYTEEH